MLNNLQIDRLQHLLGDEQTLKVVEQVFNETLDNNMPTIHFLDSNKRIGEKYRSYDQAKGLIKTAFSDLLSYKSETTKDNEVANKAR